MGQNFRHLSKNLSLLPDKVSPDKVAAVDTMLFAYSKDSEWRVIYSIRIFYQSNTKAIFLVIQDLEVLFPTLSLFLHLDRYQP